MRKHISVLGLLLLVLSITAACQKDPSKRLSPAANASCKFSDGKTITVNYSSPRMKGRKIFGDLVPYDQVWRTGANEATTFNTTANLTVGGKDVPAGSYTIFTVPGQSKWTLIINKKTGEWGIPYKYESDELARVDMNVGQTSGPVENFTIAFDQKGDSCSMSMSWENTKASIDVMEKK